MNDNTFDPFDDSFRSNPYVCYERLRREAPIHLTKFGFWLVTRYSDISEVGRSGEFSNDLQNWKLYGRVRKMHESFASTLLKYQRLQLLSIDPPAHTLMRNLLGWTFKRRMIEKLKPYVENVADALIVKCLRKRDVDIMSELAYPLPIMVICRLLGVPPEDRSRFQEWARDLTATKEFFQTPDVMKRGDRAMGAFADYFQNLMSERRRHPRNDFVSDLIGVQSETERLTDDEIIATCTLIMVAGYETTANLIGTSVLALLDNPSELTKLRRNPSLATDAVEECLRYESPIQLTSPRVPRHPVRIGDVEVPAGELVTLCLGAANRDPTLFDDPHRFRIDRQSGRHIAFGQGVHFCPGAALARLEAKTALQLLVARANIQPLSERTIWRKSITLRGLESLPVSVVPAN